MNNVKHGLYPALLGLFCMVLGGCGLFVKYIPQGKIISQTPKDHFVKIGDVNFHYTEYPELTARLMLDFIEGRPIKDSPRRWLH